MRLDMGALYFVHKVSGLVFLLPQAIVLEGSYWKQRIEVVIREYHKWRIYYKKRVRTLFFFTEHRFSSLLLHIFAHNTTMLVCWLVHTQIAQQLIVLTGNFIEKFIITRE